MTAPPTNEPLTSRLSAWLAERLGTEEVRLVDFRRHAEGYSWETFTFLAEFRDSRGEPQSLGLAIRREPQEGPLPSYDAGHEYRTYDAIRRYSHVPVPEVLWLEEDPAVLDRRFYAMRRVDGTVPVPWAAKEWEVLRSEDGRRRVGHEFVDILSRVHTIETSHAGFAFLERPSSADAVANAAIATWERMYEESAYEEVMLMRVAFRWLHANVATSGHVRIVHGDYRIGNFMLDANNHINAIFDWELVHLGDPIFDIAYSALRLYRGRSPRYSQLLAHDEYVSRYTTQTEIEVDDDVFRFWTVLGYVRALAQYFRSCHAFGEGRTDDLRLAAMSHQALYLMKFLAEDLGLRAMPA
jgi:aminoglycoside phosphotransferase (APT) family kinase protein